MKQFWEETVCWWIGFAGPFIVYFFIVHFLVGFAPASPRIDQGEALIFTCSSITPTVDGYRCQTASFLPVVLRRVE